MKIKFVIKPESVMKDYIALHWLVPKGDMRDFHHRIPKGEVWVRKDIWDSPLTNWAIKAHERRELELMIFHDYSYKRAHNIAEKVDGFW